MSVVNRLLDETKELWSRYDTHPFVLGLGDGSLDREKFRFYMIQDYLYLIDYAKVFALGVAKAEDTETMRYFANYLHHILDVEMDIHRGYMKRLGISLSEAESTPAAPDTALYGSYMLRAAYEYGAAEVAASILACALSYEVIAKNMLKRNPDAAAHPFYGEWVEGYSNAEYSEENKRLMALTERLCEGMSEAELRRISEIFMTCSVLEERFWDMAWEMRR
ncbi:MAG: thiaminase II [Clostridia bacterium]|nr:thiaminase II [Clostridia bacterium]